MPMTPFMGVRISWLIMARNSDLAWLAESARCALVRSSRFSASSCRMRSWSS